jgi:hypothetical protein
MSIIGKSIVRFALVMSIISVNATVFAQDTVASGSDNTIFNPGAPASGGKLTKEQRKAARKEARAKKNAELKKLQDQGYSPSRNDVDYPQNVQNAQKKAASAGGASH